MPTTFGIEEEFTLLDAASLEAVDLAARAVADLGDDLSVALIPEFFASQVEHASPILTTLSEALDHLTAFRRRLASWADDAGVVVAATGTPYRTRSDATIAPGDRYERIAGYLAGLAGDHQINGMHVHVGISDRDAGARISNGLRPWLPVLLALSTNSPFWHGRDTGFESWRSVHNRRLATHGMPPLLRDAEEYDFVVGALTGIGAIPDLNALNWSIRLSSRYPTVEIRVCDMQLDPESSVALAALIRALADGVLADPLPAISDAPWDGALWAAARYGIGARTLDPATGRPTTITHVVRTLRERVAPYIADAAEDHAIHQFLDAVIDRGTGATAQRCAVHGGTSSLAALYRQRLVGVDRPGTGTGTGNFGSG